MFNWSKQVVLLTGGTGSFGTAFTRYLLQHHPPKVLRIFSRDEYKQYIMQQSIRHRSLRFLLGDVRDENRLRRAMDGVTLVIHAAAMKQIVASEYNPAEAIKTNVLGTMNVLNAGLDAGVARIFGLITDKAVSPINLYGATKLCMEKLLIQGNAYRGKGRTLLSAIRYGNVAGSRGSVIPLFREQLKKGSITITHPEMTRFWLQMSEAVKLVLFSIENMRGGEVFIPKMPSFKVLDLAHVMAPKSKLKYIGTRPGEKIHEDLITHHESRNIREFGKYFILLPEFDFWDTPTKSTQGKKVPSAFSYNSQNNARFLTNKELERLVEMVS